MWYIGPTLMVTFADALKALVQDLLFDRSGAEV